MANEQDNGESSYLTGRLLVAMPGMGDPRFHKAVVLMCAHDPNGAMGLVLNHQLPGVTMEQLMEQLNITIDDSMKQTAATFPVIGGGPVETARGFVLHPNDFTQDDTIHIDDNFAVTGTIDALKAIAGGDGPQQMRFILGYAGWSAGQLDQELQQNAWLVTDASPELIFESSPDDMWDKAVGALGIDPSMLSADAGHA